MYKQGQGIIARSGLLVIGILLAAYASYSVFTMEALYMSISDATWSQSLMSLAFWLALLVFLGIGAGSIYLTQILPQSVDYLIDMDVELKKVVWPQMMPLFDPKTEAWGHTYVVIACTILLTIFIALVDAGLNVAITQGLFRLLYQ